MSAHLPRPYQVVPHPWYPLGLPSCVSLRIPGTEETSSLPNTPSMCAGRLPCLNLASAPSSILAWSSPKYTPAPCRLWPCRGAAFLAVDDRLGLALRLGSARLLGRSRDQGGRRGQHRRVSAAAPFLVSISPGLLPPLAGLAEDYYISRQVHVASPTDAVLLLTTTYPPLVPASSSPSL